MNPRKGGGPDCQHGRYPTFTRQNLVKHRAPQVDLSDVKYAALTEVRTRYGRNTRLGLFDIPAGGIALPAVFFPHVG